MLLLLQLQDLHSEQGPPPQIEPLFLFLFRYPVDLCLCPLRGQPRQVCDLQSPWLPCIDHLQRFSRINLEPRSQRLVPSDDLIDASLQRLEVYPPFDPYRPGDVVDGVTSIQLVDEPQPLLRV